MGFDHPDHDVAPFALEFAGSRQHRIGLAHTRGRAEINPQPAALRRLDQRLIVVAREGA